MHIGLQQMSVFAYTIIHLILHVGVGASRRITLKVSAHICTQSMLHVDMTFSALAHTYAKPFDVDLRLLCTHESTADIWRLRLPKMPQLGMPTVDNWDLLFDQWIP